MKFFVLIFMIFSTVVFGQNVLPNLNLSNSVDFEKDSEGYAVQNLLKLKNNEIAVSFYTNGGLGYQLNIDNFIFKENGSVKHYKQAIYYKRGKKYKKNEISLTTSEQTNLKEIIESDFFQDFSKYTQKEFEFSENTIRYAREALLMMLQKIL